MTVFDDDRYNEYTQTQSLANLNGLTFSEYAYCRERFLVPEEYRLPYGRTTPAVAHEPVTHIFAQHRKEVNWDHPRTMKRGRHDLALLVQPYGPIPSAETLLAIRDDLALFGLCLISPRDLRASVYAPGEALMFLVTSWPIAADWKWLPWQQGSGNSPIAKPVQPGPPETSLRRWELWTGGSDMPPRSHTALRKALYEAEGIPPSA